MHSDNDLFASVQNSSTFEHLKNWYKCNGKTGFMVDTIQNANATCQKMNSTIQTFLSQVKHKKSKFSKMGHFGISVCKSNMSHIFFKIDFDDLINTVAKEESEKCTFEDSTFNDDYTFDLLNTFPSRTVWTGMKLTNYSDTFLL